MNRKVRLVRFWLFVVGWLCLMAICPRQSLGFAMILGPIIWTRTSDGTTGILIHPDGPPWTIAVGDDEDSTCECCETCDLLNDPFTVDQLSTEWDDRSGTWTVSGGLLNTTSASALIVTVDEMPSGHTGAYVRAKIRCNANSDIGRLVIAYVDDSNYWFCEVQPGALGAGTAKLFERNGGTNTQRGSTLGINFSAGNTLEVCMGIANGKIQVGIIGTVAGISFTAAITTSETQAGCGTGSGTTDVKFNDFLFGVNRVDDEECYHCAAALSCCQGGNPPDNMQVVISGVTNKVGCTNCEVYNATWILAQDAGLCQWTLNRGDLSADCSAFPGIRIQLSTFSATILRLVCFHQTSLTPTGAFLKQTTSSPNNPNCETLEDFELDTEPSEAACEGSGSTVLVTSVF